MKTSYQCAIIGGGLSGLCLAIQLQRHGYEVVLFEKNTYPFHKVCGEYISMESWDFLVSLNVPLPDLNLPHISQLGVSSTSGFRLEAALPLGGFGISRYTLDAELVRIARANGVTILEDCKVQNVSQSDNLIDKKIANNPLNYTITTAKGSFEATIVFGSYGKIPPNFMQKHQLPPEPYIGVKYHIKTDAAANRIDLHNFKNGYCGISKVENDTFCLCYLSTAANLKISSPTTTSNNTSTNMTTNIAKMEEKILYQNPFLKHIFTNSDFLYEKPLTISNISFKAKQVFNNNIFTLGDAAGAIAPLCGNGMSMAMRGSKLLAQETHLFLQNRISMSQFIANYNQKWQKAFGTRIAAGYYLQHLFGNNTTTDLALKTLGKTPKILQKLISLTHGQPF